MSGTKTLMSTSVIEDRSIPEPNSGCWIWISSLSQSGYGTLVSEGIFWRAHRFSWVAHGGNDPSGKLICHRCDNRLCVNPDHLFIGDSVDNVRDMMSKGRGKKSKGERHGLSKLTEREVIEIRASYQSGRHLARTYGVSENTVWQVRRRLTWTHVEEASQ